MKVYRYNPIKMVYQLIMGIAAGVVAAIIASFFVSTEISIAIGVVVLLLFALLLISDLKRVISVNGNELMIKEGKKTYLFQIDQCNLSSKTEDNTNHTLYVEDKDDTHSFDCSHLSYNQFYSLLEDLKIVGKKSQVTKLN